MKAAIIRALMRLYPAAWRVEFGAEFEAVLARIPMSLAVVLNVAANGIHERLLQIVRQLSAGGEHAYTI